MNEYKLLQLGRLLLFVYWLGGDLGTYYASRFVTRPDLSTESRSTALNIMAGCDQAPRICMTLIFPFGVHMAWIGKMVDVSGTVVAVVWALGLAWLAMVLLLHFGSGRPLARTLTPMDFGFRVLVIVVTAGLGIHSLLGGSLIR